MRNIFARDFSLGANDEKAKISFYFARTAKKRCPVFFSLYAGGICIKLAINSSGRGYASSIDGSAPPMTHSRSAIENTRRLNATKARIVLFVVLLIIIMRAKYSKSQLDDEHKTIKLEMSYTRQ